MSFPDDTLAPEDRCEICGAELGDEIVIQEFADGSLVRLCPECAAGAALEALESYQSPLAAEDTEGDLLDTSESPFVFPEPEEELAAGLAEVSGEDHPPVDDAQAPSLAGEQPAAQVAEKRAPSPGPAVTDPLDKTRELLDPVVDLITLQREMQAALHRLAASLQVFASDVISEKLDKAVTVESRVEALERELELTRARLRETEALLAAATAGAPGPPKVTDGAPADTVPQAGKSSAGPARTEFAVPPIQTAVPEFTTPAPPPSLLPLETEPTLETVPPNPWDESPPVAEDTEESPAGEESAVGDETVTEPGPPPASPPIPPPSAEESRHHLEYHAFDLAEVQIAQRYYNESAFTARIRDVRRSLGKPRANLTKLPGPIPRALLTIAWDIIWYQYLIDLRRDIPSDQRIMLHREGLDLDELTGLFKEKNASIDDEGRLDASELEVKLLSDPTVLLTEMTPEEEQALEDATEEIWDQRTAPEFRWDD